MAGAPQYDQQGQQGGIVIDDDSGVITGPFRWISIINDAVLLSYVGNLLPNAKLVGITLPAGTAIPGVTQSLELTSGVAIAISQ